MIRVIEHLRERNEHLKKYQITIFGADRMIEENEKTISFIEELIEKDEDDKFQEERRRMVEEMR